MGFVCIQVATTFVQADTSPVEIMRARVKMDQTVDICKLKFSCLRCSISPQRLEVPTAHQLEVVG